MQPTTFRVEYALSKIRDADKDSDFWIEAYKRFGCLTWQEFNKIDLFYRCKGIVEHDRVLNNRNK